MVFNGRWDKPKVVLYCQVGRALDMLEFSLNQAVKNSGLSKKDYDLVAICWKTSDEVYDFLKAKRIKYVDMKYDEGKGFLWNLYKGWNLGYEIGFKYAKYVCPIATDHAFHKNWLRNLMKYAKTNRIVNCKLIEPGILPTLHTAINLGVTLPGKFQQEEFNKIVKKIYNNELIVDDKKYGRRLDAMPFVCPIDVWQKFGPMKKILTKNGLTGDTDFFNRCKKGNVEITKSLSSISYHCGGLETARNQSLRLKFKTNIKQYPYLYKAIIKIKKHHHS